MLSFSINEILYWRNKAIISPLFDSKERKMTEFHDELFAFKIPRMVNEDGIDAEKEYLAVYYNTFFNEVTCKKKNK